MRSKEKNLAVENLKRISTRKRASDPKPAEITRKNNCLQMLHNHSRPLGLGFEPLAFREGSPCAQSLQEPHILPDNALASGPCKSAVEIPEPVLHLAPCPA
jgi:hypothetical protein